MSKIGLEIAIAATLICVGTSSLAAKQSRPMEAPPKSEQKEETSETTLSPSDRQFIEQVATVNATEVSLGKLAEDRGSLETVKAFGKRMQRDHQLLQDQLKMLAERKSLRLPEKTLRPDEHADDHFQKLTGSKFDEAYMNDMVAHHKKDVAEFRKKIPQIKDPELKAWAESTVTKLEEHLQAAEQIKNTELGRDQPSKPKEKKSP